MDLCVTVPRNFRYGDAKPGLAAWLSEGDAPGEEHDGEEYDFTTFGACPDISKGERVYICCDGRIVGYAPLTDIGFDTRWREQRMFPYRYSPEPHEVTFKWPLPGWGSIHLIRAGGAVAITIPEKVVGFRGWRYRWWEYAVETPIDLSAWMLKAVAGHSLF